MNSNSNNAKFISALRAVSLLSEQERKDLFEIFDALASNLRDFNSNSSNSSRRSNQDEDTWAVVLSLREMPQWMVDKYGPSFAKIVSFFNRSSFGQPLSLSGALKEGKRYILYRGTRRQVENHLMDCRCSLLNTMKDGDVLACYLEAVEE